MRNRWSDGRFDFVTLLSTSSVVALVLALLAPVAANAAEHVTLRNGFEQDCVRLETAGERVRLYPLPAGRDANAAPELNYFEVDRTEIVRVEELPGVAAAPLSEKGSEKVSETLNGLSGNAQQTQPTAHAVRPALQKAAPDQKLSRDQISPLLADAEQQHNVDADLLWSVVKAESSGQARAVSRAGAQGLMQLMPGTAADLGVADSFEPRQNIGGGAAYLDLMLTRYHNNLMLALAAYNAGPAAVDRWRGIPPYRETRVYVERVIHEFNARKRMMAAKTGPQVASVR